MEYKSASSKPYPCIKVERKNPLYGEILLQDLAGQISEETSIHKYLYQSVIQEEQNDFIASVLEDIAKVEMHHLKILLKLIHLLGVDPKFRTIECFYDQPVYWKAQYVPYETDLQKILDFGIEQERKVIDQYQNHIQIIQDSYIQDILNRIVLDEKIHIETLQKLQNLKKI